MNKLGPIIVIDNDLEDLDLIGDALNTIKVNNKILLFDRATEFLRYTKDHNEMAFFILCDVNMPNMDGLELFQEINNNPSLSSICFPFLFFSTSSDRDQIQKAYKLPIQGYFKKPSTFDGIITMLEGIITYWDNCYHPMGNKYFSGKVHEPAL